MNELKIMMNLGKLNILYLEDGEVILWLEMFKEGGNNIVEIIEKDDDKVNNLDEVVDYLYEKSFWRCEG